jgi:hypothetical protein
MITLAGIIAMAGAGANSVPDRQVQAVVSQDFYEAFLAITNPVFAYAGHFMFFILISEMKQPHDAMKVCSAYSIVVYFNYLFATGRVGFTGFLNLILRHICGCDLLLSRLDGCISRISLFTSKMGQGCIWYCHRQLSLVSDQ